MWIALGIIGVLWFVGMVVVPDKNAPANAQAPAVSVPQTASAPPAQ
jgi:hypothetical protein